MRTAAWHPTMMPHEEPTMTNHDRTNTDRHAPPGPSAAVDDLMLLVGRLALERLDTLPERELTELDRRFLRWWVREERARMSAEERAAMDVRAEAWADRALARQLAARCRVALAGAPPDVVPDDERPVRRVMEDGRRTGRIAAGEYAVAAGVGRELWDEPCAATIGRPVGLPKGDYLALRVSGESMRPLMHDGDLMLVKVGAPAVRDAIVVARRPDDGWVVKRVGRVTRETIALESLNADYPAVEVPNDARLVLGTVVMRWCAHDAA